MVQGRQFFRVDCASPVRLHFEDDKGGSSALWGPFTRSQLDPYKPTYFLDSIKDLPSMLDRISTKNAG